MLTRVVLGLVGSLVVVFGAIAAPPRVSGSTIGAEHGGLYALQPAPALRLDPFSALHPEGWPGGPSAQTAPTVRLRLDPTNVDVVAGESFDLAILVDAGIAQFDGVDVRLDFDPAYFEVVDATGTPAGSIGPGPDSPAGGLDPLLNRVDNARGRIDYAAARLSGTASGTVRLAGARLRARGPTGPSRIRFAFDRPTGRMTDVTLASLLMSGPTDSVLAGVDELAVTVGPRPQVFGLRVANVEPTALTVIWATDVATTGRVHFGPTGGDIAAAAFDGRGSSYTTTVHFVRVEGLQAGQTYQFDVDSGGAVESRSGQHYAAATAAAASTDTGLVISGTVHLADGRPAVGAAVLVRVRDADAGGTAGESAPLAALTDEVGTWRLSLRPVAAVSGGPFASSAGDEVVVEVEGGAAGTAAARFAVGGGGDSAPLTLEQSTNVDLPIAAGWNLLALPVEPTAPLAASDLVRLLQESGVVATQVVRWRDGRWNSYLAEFPANDFSLDVGRGYFVRTAGAGRLTLAGRPLRAAPTLDLLAGWNLVGLGYPRGGISAGALLAGAARNGLDLPQIARWTQGRWESYRAELQTGDFALLSGSAAFLQVPRPAIWRPAEP